jgi:type II secretory pathway pseudopilin PulG
MRDTKGFTLVEAALAIGVVAILSGIILPLVLKNIRDSRLARARNDLQVLAGAVAMQLRDTGRRPMAPGGPGGADGRGQALWGSDGANPIVLNAGGPAPPPGPMVGIVPPGSNRFVNLLASPPDAAANTLFGHAFPPGNESGYRGAYLSGDMARKADPWGRRYLLFGYNQEGNDRGGPIWLVSAGPAGTIEPTNIVPRFGFYPPVWTYAGSSAGNLAIRVN